jgi:methionyl-tRNA formyltransferase
MPARVMLFGDGRWAADTLLRLAADGHQLAAVVARARPSDGTLGAAAARLGVPVLRPASVNSEQSVAALAALEPDLVLSVAYDQILRAPVLSLAPLGCLNVHAGKLPRYRGRNVVNWAIINGETEIGLTVHHMDEGIDTGDIVLQRTLPIGWTDDYATVLARVVDAVPALAAEAVAGVVAGSAERRPQDAAQGTYFGGRGPGDEWLDWRGGSRELHNKVRAITRPGPGARTMLNDRAVVVWRAHWEPTWPTYVATPGQVVGRHPDGLLVKTGDSTLLLLEVQQGDEPPARPAWPIGTRLGIDVAAAVATLLRRLETLEARQGQEVP